MGFEKGEHNHEVTGIYNRMTIQCAHCINYKKYPHCFNPNRFDDMEFTGKFEAYHSYEEVELYVDDVNLYNLIFYWLNGRKLKITVQEID